MAPTSLPYSSRAASSTAGVCALTCIKGVQKAPPGSVHTQHVQPGHPSAATAEMNKRGSCKDQAVDPSPRLHCADTKEWVSSQQRGKPTPAPELSGGLQGSWGPTQSRSTLDTPPTSHQTAARYPHPNLDLVQFRASACL